LAWGVGGDHAAQQVAADARAADGDDAHAFVVAVAERAAVGWLGWVEAGDVAGEVVVLAGPVADGRQSVAEGIGNDVVGVADEDGAVAQPGEAGDVLDHLGVVVRGQERLAAVGAGHRQPADEVGEPGVGCAFLLGVLVQVVVEFPGFVADPQVVVFLAGQVVEDHEVGQQDLVHPPDGVEGVQVVLGGLGLDVPGLAGQVCAGRVDVLAALGQQRGDRVLGEPVDLQSRMQLAQLIRDRHVSLRMPQPNRRGHIQRPLAPGPPPHPPRRWQRRAGELPDEQVRADRVAHMRPMTRTLEQDEITAGRLGEGDPHGGAGDLIGRALDHQHWAGDPLAQLARGVLVYWVSEFHRYKRLGGCLQAPAHAVLDRLGRVRLAEHPGKEELQEAAVIPQPVVAVSFGPALVGVQHFIPRITRALRRQPGQPHARADEDSPRDTVRVLGRKDESTLRTERQ
jgi:hypothetical protein